MFKAKGKREIQGETFSSIWKTWSGGSNSHLPIAVNAMLNLSIIMKIQGIDETFFFYSSVEKELFKKICYSFLEKE